MSEKRPERKFVVAYSSNASMAQLRRSLTIQRAVTSLGVGAEFAPEEIFERVPLKDRTPEDELDIVITLEMVTDFIENLVRGRYIERLKQGRFKLVRTEPWGNAGDRAK